MHISLKCYFYNRWQHLSNEFGQLLLVKPCQSECTQTSLLNGGQQTIFIFVPDVQKQTQNDTASCLITSLLCVANRNCGSLEKVLFCAKAVLSEGWVIKQRGLITRRRLPVERKETHVNALQQVNKSCGVPELV